MVLSNKKSRHLKRVAGENAGRRGYWRTLPPADTRCVEDKLYAWAVHVNQICVSGLAISKSWWDF